MFPHPAVPAVRAPLPTRVTLVASCWLTAVCGCLVAGLPAAQQDSTYTPPEPTRKVAVAMYQWRDAARDRVVPVKVYYPEEPGGAWPLVLYSHGLGGSRLGGEYLGRHWAGCGYVSVHLQHAGSDESVWKDLPLGQRISALKLAAMRPKNFLDRPQDVRFVIDEVLRLNRDPESPLFGRVDPAAIGMSGHSFGAHTTLSVAGQVYPGLAGREVQMAEPRIKAAISMSAPAPQRRSQLDRAYSQITIPVLHMTGTADVDPVSGTDPSDRRIPFDHMTAAQTYLVVLDGGDHQVFSDRVEKFGPRDGTDDALFHRLILAGTTAFWDAYLKQNAAAKDWLDGDGYTRLLGDKATFEIKRPKQKADATDRGQGGR